jgi:hypothetical protein
MWYKLLSSDHHMVKMEAVQSSEMLASYYITTQCHNPEDCNLNLHHHDTIGSISSHNMTID